MPSCWSLCPYWIIVLSFLTSSIFSFMYSRSWCLLPSSAYFFLLSFLCCDCCLPSYSLVFRLLSHWCLVFCFLRTLFFTLLIPSCILPTLFFFCILLSSAFLMTSSHSVVLFNVSYFATFCFIAPFLYCFIVPFLLSFLHLFLVSFSFLLFYSLPVVFLSYFLPLFFHILLFFSRVISPAYFVSSPLAYIVSSTTC